MEYKTNKTKILIGLIIFLAFSSIINAKSPFTLVIDAGHGGKDVGAIGATAKEKDINLSIALAFGKYVENNLPNDVKVIYTRTTDVFIPLKERADIANKAKADLFISIHTNSVPIGKPSPMGFQVYTLGMHRAKDNLDVAIRENAVISLEKNYTQTYHGFDPTSSESYIMFEFLQSANMSRSIKLAQLIQHSVCNKAGRADKGIHQAGFLVLRETSMPSCLIELGFITSAEEETFLTSANGIDLMARGIYEAFVQYKNLYDSKPVIPYKNSNYAIETPVINSTPQQYITTKESTETKQNSKKQEKKQTITHLKNTQLKNTQLVNSKEQKTEIKQINKKDTIKKKEKEKTLQTNKKGLTSNKSEKAEKQLKVKPQKEKDKTKEEKSSIVFKVQIFASKRKIEQGDKTFKNHKDVTHFIEKGEHKYKYTIGSSNSYKEIQQLRKNLLSDFPQAYIVAFKQGKIITINEALNENKKNSSQKHSKK